MMTYRQTLDYMYSMLPMFHRIGSAAYKADLDNTIAICKLLGNPEKKFRSIHVGGTNGKGSSSHLLAAIFQSAGYKTGLYTSPHLKDFRERIRINGKMIPKKSVIDFIEHHKNDFEKIKPSFFEMTVGLAFDHFAKEKVDLAIIEVGLGGRLDSTNVITPLLSLITNISYDHTNLLGNTLEKIAGEKAGIIKKNTPVVISQTQPGVKKVFEQKAKANNSPLIFADHVFKTKQARQKKVNGKLMLELKLRMPGIKNALKLRCSLPGLYQAKNIPGVVAAVGILNARGFLLSNAHIQNGIEKVTALTGLRGRWEVLQRSPLVVADTGHNEAGIKEVLRQVSATPHRQLHFILGMVNDKDITTILSLLPKKAKYYFCKASIPRALPAHELAAQAQALRLKGEIYPSVKKALRAAKQNAGRHDLILIGGSTFTVADAL